MIDDKFWKALEKLDPFDVCQRSLASLGKKEKTYRLPILNRIYLISPGEKIIFPENDPSSGPCEFYLQLSAINYLIGAKPVPLSNCWVSEKDFLGGSLFFRGIHSLPVSELERVFGRESRKFHRVSKACGGKEVKGGDLAYELPMFPRLPVRILLWLEDKEFPARVLFLFDKTANIHLRLDGIWAVGKAIERALLERASSP